MLKFAHAHIHVLHSHALTFLYPKQADKEAAQVAIRRFDIFNLLVVATIILSTIFVTEALLSWPLLAICARVSADQLAFIMATRWLYTSVQVLAVAS